MIRHIPNKYSLRTLTEELNHKFQNKYDIVSKGSSSLDDLERQFPGLISGDLNSRYGDTLETSTKIQIQSTDYLKEIRDFLLSLKPKSSTNKTTDIAFFAR